MINSYPYFFDKNINERYIEDFNKYVMSVLYGKNVLIGSEIEDEWKDIEIDDKK